MCTQQELNCDGSKLSIPPLFMVWQLARPEHLPLNLPFISEV
jgi:hypothetical protein